MHDFIYIIQEWASFGISEIAYCLDEKIAISKFKQIVKEEIAKAKKDGTWAKQEDLDRVIPNGHIEKSDAEFDKNELYSATISTWYKSSYEYDEWDIGGSTFKLVKRELVK